MFQLCVLIRNKCNDLCQLYAKFQKLLYNGYVRFKDFNSVSTHQRRCHQPDSEAGHTDKHFGICH